MNQSILEKTVQLLLTRHLSLAVAESLSCGHLQAAFGALSGSSGFFAGGITAYQIPLKVSLLQVDPAHALAVNGVSPQVALEMARGACKLFQSDIGIGTTGYAEPSPVYEVAEPFAYFAICRQTKPRTIVPVVQEIVHGDGLNRLAMQQRVCEQAILALLGYLQGLGEKSN